MGKYCRPAAVWERSWIAESSRSLLWGCNLVPTSWASVQQHSRKLCLSWTEKSKKIFSIKGSDDSFQSVLVSETKISASEYHLLPKCWRFHLDEQLSLKLNEPASQCIKELLIHPTNSCMDFSRVVVSQWFQIWVFSTPIFSMRTLNDCYFCYFSSGSI